MCLYVWESNKSSDDGVWDSSTIFTAHAIGTNAVSWAPAVIPGSLTSGTASSPSGSGPQQLVTAGCDNLVKIWTLSPSSGWTETNVLQGHSDWVRDVSWAPSIGLEKSYIASAGQDKTVIIWTLSKSSSEWIKTELKGEGEGFEDVIWRVRYVRSTLFPTRFITSWSPSGNVLAVSSGDNKVSLWKEGASAQQGWLQVTNIGE